MNKNLLIIGADYNGLAAKETAEAMGNFEKISFLDDNIKETPDGKRILGVVKDFRNFVTEYSNIFVAIENPEIRLNLLNKIKETTAYRIVTLISPKAYISPTAQVMQGSVVEAMAVVNTGSVISTGCIIGAESIVNHCSMCCDGVHVECNATVADNTVVPAGTTIYSGTVFKRNITGINDLFFNSEELRNSSDKLKKTQGSSSANGRKYCFEDGM